MGTILQSALDSFVKLVVLIATIDVSRDCIGNS